MDRVLGTDEAALIAHVKQRLAILQWAVPALTGALVVLNAKMGEQQRPQNVVQGVVERFR